MRPSMLSSLLPRLLPPAFAIALAVLVGNVLILANGENPASVWSMLLAGTWGSAYGIGQVVFKATPLALAGFSVALALRAGLFNVGAEGQMQLGALACGVAGAYLPSGTPAWAALPLCALAATGSGAALGALPGWLRARFGAHEVITTIMLNFVAAAFVGYVMSHGLALPETLHTRAVVAGASIARLGEAGLPALRGSAASWAVLTVPFAALAYWSFLRYTKRGLELRAVGHNADAAGANGVSVGAIRVLAMSLAGAFAASSALSNVLGYKRFFEQGFGAGAGFMGIAVALLGQGDPIGICAAALLFGTLSQGGLAINARVPKDLVEVLQAAVILAIVASSKEVHRLVRAAAARRASDPSSSQETR